MHIPLLIMHFWLSCGPSKQPKIARLVQDLNLRIPPTILQSFEPLSEFPRHGDIEPWLSNDLNASVSP